MSNIRVWLFRALVVIGIGLLVASWFMPWWGIVIHEFDETDAVQIHPYAMVIHPDVTNYLHYIKGYEMPAWFFPLMWAYFGIVVASSIFSLAVKDKKFGIWKIKFGLPSFIIGLAGFSYIIVMALGAIVISIRAGSYFNTPLQGYLYIDLGAPYQSGANTSLYLGYWLGCAVGPLLLALGLLRSKIIGKPRAE